MNEFKEKSEKSRKRIKNKEENTALKFIKKSKRFASQKPT